MKYLNNANFILFLIGAIVLSPFSFFLTVSCLHLPLNVVEFLLIPFIPFLVRYFHIQISIRLLIYLILFIICGILIGIFIDHYSLRGILSVARTYAVCGLCFLCSYNNPYFELKKLEWICWGTSVVWAIFSLNYYFMFLPFLWRESSFGNTYGNLLAINYLFFFSLLNSDKKRIFSVFLLILIISLFSGNRRSMFTFVFAWVVSLPLSAIIGQKKNIIISLILGAVAVFTFFIAEDFIYENFPDLHFRLYIKTFKLLGQEIERTDYSDDQRKENYKKLLNTESFLLPQGFVSKQTNTEVGTGIFIDCPLYEFAYTLGWPLFLILFFFFIKKTYYYYLVYSKMKIIDDGIVAGMCISLLFIFFLDGMFLSFIYIVPFTASLLGIIFSKSDHSIDYLLQK